jgi:ABC-type Mn2+/Zn2+ transport system permease subunit
VAVTHWDLISLVFITVLIFIVHVLFRREFLYTSADADFLKTKGIKTKSWMILLYMTLTLGITLSMRTLGSLPVFALMVIPPWIALKRAHNLREAFLISLFLGIVIPPLGYYLSFIYSFPTGASLIVVAFMYVLMSSLEAYFVPSAGQARSVPG